MTAKRKIRKPSEKGRTPRMKKPLEGVSLDKKKDSVDYASNPPNARKYAIFGGTQELILNVGDSVKDKAKPNYLPPILHDQQPGPH